MLTRNGHAAKHSTALRPAYGGHLRRSRQTLIGCFLALLSGIEWIRNRHLAMLGNRIKSAFWSGMSDVARILSQIESGAAQAAERLPPLVNDKLRRLKGPTILRSRIIDNKVARCSRIGWS